MAGQLEAKWYRLDVVGGLSVPRAATHGSMVERGVRMVVDLAGMAVDGELAVMLGEVMVLFETKRLEEAV